MVLVREGNEYLATTNDYCPHENKGAAPGAVSLQLARLAAEWGFGLLEGGRGPNVLTTKLKRREEERRGVRRLTNGQAEHDMEVRYFE